MPIYAYRCESCGHAKDVLQKLSDPLLTVCPACGEPTFKKQVTAAGFQLKGSGWYVTDFRDGNKSAGTAEKPGDKPAEKPAESSSDKPATPAAAPAAPSAPAAAPAASPPPAPSSGGGTAGSA